MATIAEIRTKYPQYNDLSDTQIADSFHSKFYSDIPKEQFYAQLGIKKNVPADTSIMGQFRQGASADFEKAKTAPVVGPVGMIEAGLNLASGTVSSAVGGLAGLVGTAIDGPDAGATAVRNIQEAGTYQPRTEAGKQAVETVSAPFKALGLAGEYVGGGIGKVLGNEELGATIGGGLAEAAPLMLPLVRGTKNIATTPYTGTGIAVPNVLANARASAARDYIPVEAAKSSARIEKLQQEQFKIDAAKDAVDLGIKINPAEVNRTTSNRGVSTLAGGKVSMDAATALENLNVNIPKVARKDLGIAEGTKITPEVFDTVINAAGKPAEAIKSIPSFADTSGNFVKNLESAKITSNIAGKEAVATRELVNGLIDDNISNISQGMSGKDVIDTIRTYREQARNTLGRESATSLERDAARAKLSIAKSYEGLIEENLAVQGQVPLLKAYREGRTLQAKAFTWKDAFNNDTGIFDPQIIAKQTAADSALTGSLAKIGKIANNFPGALSKPSSSALQRITDLTKSHFSRAGPLGVAGTVLGTAVGSPMLGGIAGMALGEALAPLMKNKAISAEYQAANVVPKDSSLVSEYVPQQPSQGYTPNFTMGGRAEAPMMAESPQLGYRSPAEYVAERQARASAAARAVEEQQAAAEASRPRAPTSGGMVLDLDPITGRLVPADRGVKGATPEVFQANTGASLSAAAEKVAAGKKFDLTAAEKVAWDKTAVDIKQISSEFNSLSPKQVAEKMADRQWVQDAINKANQKAEMFAQLEKNSRDVKAQSIARVSREKMLDIAEQLQETLGGRPSSRGYGQGPKTRAFQRGLLSGDGQ